LKVALVAEEGAGNRVLHLLSKRGHNVVLFTSTDSDGPLSTLMVRARTLGIEIRAAEEVRDPETAGWMREERVALVLNVHSLHIIDADVLAAPRLGAYNLHPGPLPERAGLHAASWALYEGADRYGVTLHRMSPQVDAGTIAFADDFAIRPADTGLTVMTQCVRHGLRLIEALVEMAERGEAIPAHPQDLARRRWFTAGPPKGGRLDWYLPARRVTDFVRACDYRPFPSPWGFPWCKRGSTRIAILSARALDRAADAIPGTVVHADGGAVLVAATDAWVRVGTVEIAGRTAAAAEAIPHGSRLE
jgi:UDP-4-amino-4-deoxy-L-arabinose formyltransferase/UDP-glucuronic acid dehydrogenase (UDP-4-keto-hexauronic acid decarboxylating)